MFDISIDSNLRIIEENAYYRSTIKSIAFPNHLMCIENFAFANCLKLERVEISENSELQTNRKYAFYRALIEHIFFYSSPHTHLQIL